MATTWMKALHIGKKRTVSTAIRDVIDYVENPGKTDGGRLIAAYGCDSRVADEEFLLAKRQYHYLTGRDQGRRDVLAYHIRQSFKPGEVDEETANRIGYELAMSFTKGRHAFVVCTHIDKHHVHNHIIFNSTALDCDRKFEDFKRSGRAIRRISDLLCAQNGLSVIAHPGPSRGRDYGQWLGADKEPTWQDKIRVRIDEILPGCTSFEGFIAAMKQAGCTINDKRKYITVRLHGQKKPTRLDTLKGDHTEQAIRERIAGTRIVSSGAAGGRQISDVKPTPRRTEETPNLLIDIEAKIKQGYGKGYERWANIHNLKEAAKTLLFLQENGVTDLAALEQKAAEASALFMDISSKIKDAETRMAAISELQKHISNYGRTREVYKAYREAGYSKKFRAEHDDAIRAHQDAKKHFDSLGLTKLPSISMLKQEYAALLSERKKLYSGYRETKEKMKHFVTAKSNVQNILRGSGSTRKTQNRDAKPRGQNREI